MLKIKWGVVTSDGKYVADPSGKTDAMAWTYDLNRAERIAELQQGKVVDVENFVRAFNSSPSEPTQCSGDGCTGCTGCTSLPESTSDAAQAEPKGETK